MKKTANPVQQLLILALLKQKAEFEEVKSVLENLLYLACIAEVTHAEKLEKPVNAIDPTGLTTWDISCDFEVYDEKYWNSTGNYHFGRDFIVIDGGNNTEGNPIYNVEVGTIYGFGNNESMGNYLVTQHSDENGNTFYRTYQHLSELSDQLKVGEIIDNSAYIGLGGNEGVSSGAHVHIDKFYLKKDEALKAGFTEDEILSSNSSTERHYVDPEINVEEMNEINHEGIQQELGKLADDIL